MRVEGRGINGTNSWTLFSGAELIHGGAVWAAAALGGGGGGGGGAALFTFGNTARNLKDSVIC